MRTLLTCLLFAIPAAACAGELRVGAAGVVITPPVGTPMAGYYSVRAAEGVRPGASIRTRRIAAGLFS